jgi:hydrogenase-4 component E
MSTALMWVLIGLGFGIVVVRRRTTAIGLLAVQSLLLGAVAVGEAVDTRAGLAVAAGALIARAIVLPLLLLRIVRATREPRRVIERPALVRLVGAAAAVVLAAALVPSFGLEEGAENAAAALVVLGIVIAAMRGPVVLQAVGFLVAENGVYLAGLAVAGGLPGAIELGLLFDLVVVLGVAAAFGSKIHEEFGSGDTTLLRGLRD